MQEEYFFNLFEVEMTGEICFPNIPTRLWLKNVSCQRPPTHTATTTKQKILRILAFYLLLEIRRRHQEEEEQQQDGKILIAHLKQESG